MMVNDVSLRIQEKKSLGKFVSSLKCDISYEYFTHYLNIFQFVTQYLNFISSFQLELKGN